jgi:hypothetical protein
MSLAINSPNDMHDVQLKPWYRYGWPWFLMSFPLLSMILGAMMLYLGMSANNSLVVDDYYREGKAINQRIERDRVSALLGLNATLESTLEGVIVQFSRLPPADLPASLQEAEAGAAAQFQWPETLQLEWIHVTQAEHDGAARLRSIGGERYLARGIVLPASGRYRIHVQPSDDSSWRLVSPLLEMDASAQLAIPARLPEDVYPLSAFDQIPQKH